MKFGKYIRRTGKKHFKRKFKGKRKFATLKKVNNKVVRIQRLMKSDLKFAD